jgi:hypothetical protein
MRNFIWCSHGAWYMYVIKYTAQRTVLYRRSDLMNLVPIDGLSAAEGLQSRFLESYENIEDEN